MTSIAASLFSLSPPPKVVDVPGVPETFCEIAVVKDAGETVRILLCKKIEGSEDVEVVGEVRMPMSGFLTSLNWAATQFLFRKH